MASLATRPNNRSVEDFLKTQLSPKKADQARKIISILVQITGENPQMWGNAKVKDFIIGFGKVHYQRKQGKEWYEWFKIGFAPRKNKTTLYLPANLEDYSDKLLKLGNCNWGKGCLYLKTLDNLNYDGLEALIREILRK